MKKFLGFVLAFMLFALGGCTVTKDIDVIVSISVDSGFAGQTFFVGQQVKLDNYTLTVKYESGLSKDVPMSSAEVTGVDTSSAGSKEVSITYGGFNIKTSIFVKAASATNIMYAGSPLHFYVGEQIDLSDVFVRVLFEDGSEQTICVNTLTHSAIDFADSDSKSMTVTYDSLTVTIQYSTSYREIELDTQYALDGNDVLVVLSQDAGGSIQMRCLKTSDSSESYEVYRVGVTLNENNTFSFIVFDNSGMSSYIGYLASGTIFITKAE